MLYFIWLCLKLTCFPLTHPAITTDPPYPALAIACMHDVACMYPLLCGQAGSLVSPQNSRPRRWAHLRSSWIPMQPPKYPTSSRWTDNTLNCRLLRVFFSFFPFHHWFRVLWLRKKQQFFVLIYFFFFLKCAKVRNVRLPYHYFVFSGMHSIQSDLKFAWPFLNYFCFYSLLASTCVAQYGDLCLSLSSVWLCSYNLLQCLEERMCILNI